MFSIGNYAICEQKIVLVLPSHSVYLFFLFLVLLPRQNFEYAFGKECRGGRGLILDPGGKASTVASFGVMLAVGFL